MVQMSAMWNRSISSYRYIKLRSFKEKCNSGGINSQPNESRNFTPTHYFPARCFIEIAEIDLATSMIVTNIATTANRGRHTVVGPRSSGQTVDNHNVRVDQYLNKGGTGIQNNSGNKDS